MKLRNSSLSFFCMLAAVIIMPQPLTAQSGAYIAPRTAYGQPDLQGTFTFRTLTPMQRPADFADQGVLNADQAEVWTVNENLRQNRDLIDDSVGGAGYAPGVISYNEFWYERGDVMVEDRRTSLIIDPPNGRIPPLTEAAQQRRRDVTEIRRLSLGPEARPYAERCIVTRTSGPPMQPGSYNLNVQFVQTADHFMIMNEMIHNVRVVRMNAEHRDGPALKWEGDSVGHFEGETLVVDTINFMRGTAFADSTPNMHLIERFTRLGDDTLAYQFTVEDPTTWTQSWTALVPMKRIDLPIYEYACHEGNHGLHGVMAGIRRLEQDAIK